MSSNLTLTAIIFSTTYKKDHPSACHWVSHGRKNGEACGVLKCHGGKTDRSRYATPVPLNPARAPCRIWSTSTSFCFSTTRQMCGRCAVCCRRAGAGACHFRVEQFPAPAATAPLRRSVKTAAGRTLPPPKCSRPLPQTTASDVPDGAKEAANCRFHRYSKQNCRSPICGARSPQHQRNHSHSTSPRLMASAERSTSQSPHVHAG